MNENKEEKLKSAIAKISMHPSSMNNSKVYSPDFKISLKKLKRVNYLYEIMEHGLFYCLLDESEIVKGELYQLLELCRLEAEEKEYNNHHKHFLKPYGDDRIRMSSQKSGLIIV